MWRNCWGLWMTDEIFHWDTINFQTSAPTLIFQVEYAALHLTPLPKPRLLRHSWVFSSMLQVVRRLYWNMLKSESAEGIKRHFLEFHGTDCSCLTKLNCSPRSILRVSHSHSFCLSFGRIDIGSGETLSTVFATNAKINPILLECCLSFTHAMDEAQVSFNRLPPYIHEF